jgi:hypothetical protein
MRRAVVLLLLAAAAWSDEPEGRHPIIPPGDPFPWCGTGRVWTGPLRVRVMSGGAPVEGVEVVLESGIGCTTDGNGIARFQSADSTDTVRIREVGYFPAEKDVPPGPDVTVRGGETIDLEIRLP